MSINYSDLSEARTGPNKRWLSVSSICALLFSVIALIISVWAIIGVVPKRPVLCEDPGEFIRIRYDNQSRRPGYLADDYFEYINRKEILKTLRVVHAYTNSDLCVALYMYSVSNKVFHSSERFVKVKDKYWLPYYVHSGMKEGMAIEQVNWLRWVEEEIQDWENKSAKPY